MRNLVPIALIKSLGFRVFVSGFRVFVSDVNAPTYCYFVQGDKIGYIQAEATGTFSLTTVHKPNLRTGTGFSVARDLTAADLTAATLRKAFVMYPDWAWCTDRESVQKYKNVEDFLKKYNMPYFEV
jgi:hypothetical protein